jgi:hypothetical protein
LWRDADRSVDDLVVVADVTVVPVDSDVICDSDDGVPGAGDDFPLEGDLSALS